PVPTGSVRSESERRKTLDRPVTAVSSAGTNRVKPADDFMQKAKAISRMPAMPSSAHAIEDTPVRSLATVLRPDEVDESAQTGFTPATPAFAADAGGVRNETPNRLKAFINPIA